MKSIKKILSVLVICLTLFSFMPPSLTFAQGHKELPPPSEASVELMAGQMIMMGFRGARAAANPVLTDIKNLELGGVILFDRDYNSKLTSRNVTSKSQLTILIKALHEHSDYPLFVAVDQEGGKVCRLKVEKGFMYLPSAREMGAQSVKQTEKLAEELATELDTLGINVDFAPVVDVEVNPNNPAIARLDRSFSPDPKIVTDQARAFLQGLASQHIIGCIKHFPGHASSLTDTHLGMADITDTWQSDIELYPYKQLISENIVDIVMVGHLINKDIDEDYPASLSEKHINVILRGQLGFKGLVISDDLQMSAINDHYSLEEVVFLSINAGMDILLYGNNIKYDPDLGPKIHAAILKLVANGKISRERLEESYTRIYNLKKKLK